MLTTTQAVSPVKVTLKVTLLKDKVPTVKRKFGCKTILSAKFDYFVYK